MMDFRDQTQKVYHLIAKIGDLGVRLLWHLLHFLVSLWYFSLGIASAIESYLISRGILKRYKALDIGKLRYLAIVVESEDAYQIPKVIKLLQCLVAIGVKRVCLYDSEAILLKYLRINVIIVTGILKKSKESILARLNNATLFEEAGESNLLLDRKHITLEFVSPSDGKEAVAKAANLLFIKYLKSGDSGKIEEEIFFTEAHLTDALRAVGCRGPEPDLLLVYGPARCHLGFPAWRIRYTEIVDTKLTRSQHHAISLTYMCLCLSLMRTQEFEEPVKHKQAYGTLEVHETRFPHKGYLQVHHGSPKLW
ncbi:hypothetical protein JRO89_XS02G0049200 [Xanthoceras sorbifolium]|uniref:ditrans,polycis-polyprenyl diphosphate synthase [(2E,6E)-farnesyldiphosphate specific] n=1 Tax=Xanthoceras sorbifolium TaxID=99658 RepID=A0ABQ8IFA3_9ROSI|nr:hypothetical protein JRO89_XS02G0049200 [Xanthoceras sorbifolium]